MQPGVRFGVVGVQVPDTAGQTEWQQGRRCADPEQGGGGEGGARCETDVERVLWLPPDVASQVTIGPEAVTVQVPDVEEGGGVEMRAVGPGEGPRLLGQQQQQEQEAIFSIFVTYVLSSRPMSPAACVAAALSLRDLLGPLF